MPQVRVGDRVLSVRLVRGLIEKPDGVHLAYFEPSSLTIEVSAELPGSGPGSGAGPVPGARHRLRLAALLQALHLAWAVLVPDPEPGSRHSAARRFARMAISLIDDLWGPEAALEAEARLFKRGTEGQGDVGTEGRSEDMTDGIGEGDGVGGAERIEAESEELAVSGTVPGAGTLERRYVPESAEWSAPAAQVLQRQSGLRGRPAVAGGPRRSAMLPRPWAAGDAEDDHVPGARRIVALGELELTDCAAPPADLKDCCQCAVCQRRVGAGQVVNEPAVQGPLGWQTLRTLYCDFCRHLQMWIEASQVPGGDLVAIPTGVPLTPEPTFERDPVAIEAFLAAHPQAAGVEM